METKTYLIPANTKRGSLIFNVFTPNDLILLGVGISITLVLIFTMTADNLLSTIIILGPGLICSFLVLPVPNYHNVLTVIKSALNFYTERRTFIWKGWCIHEYEENGKE